MSIHTDLHAGTSKDFDKYITAGSRVKAWKFGSFGAPKTYLVPKNPNRSPTPQNWLPSPLRKYSPIMITADKKSIFGGAMLMTFSHDLTRHKRSEILFPKITKHKKGYLSCSPKHFDLGMSVQKANCAKCPPYLRFRLWFALQSIQLADLGLAPIFLGSHHFPRKVPDLPVFWPFRDYVEKN